MLLSELGTSFGANYIHCIFLSQPIRSTNEAGNKPVFPVLNNIQYSCHCQVGRVKSNSIRRSTIRYSTPLYRFSAALNIELTKRQCKYFLIGCSETRPDYGEYYLRQLTQATKSLIETIYFIPISVF